MEKVAATAHGSSVMIASAPASNDDISPLTRIANSSVHLPPKYSSWDHDKESKTNVINFALFERKAKL